MIILKSSLAIYDNNKCFKFQAIGGSDKINEERLLLSERSRFERDQVILALLQDRYASVSQLNDSVWVEKLAKTIDGKKYRFK